MCLRGNTRNLMTRLQVQNFINIKQRSTLDSFSIATNARYRYCAQACLSHRLDKNIDKPYPYDKIVMIPLPRHNKMNINTNTLVYYQFNEKTVFICTLCLLLKSLYVRFCTRCCTGGSACQSNINGRVGQV